MPSFITSTQEPLGPWEQTQFESIADVHKNLENVDGSALKTTQLVNGCGLAVLNWTVFFILGCQK